MTLIAKPFITIYGDAIWCEHIERSCIPNLPMEPTEWIRKTGSDFKLVHVDIDARKFNDSDLKDFGSTILDSPLFHLFVIVENEDQYTKTNKIVFDKWIGALRARSIDAWKLFVVPDDSQKNKFTFNRFSISARMKIDFNIQKIDNHLLKISENPKERFSQIQTLLRDIVLDIYDDRCFKNEDKIRIQRETRFTPQWNYFDYFSLQEELADVYECLSLYEESLVQFDETNFIFVKCLDGFYKGESSYWINNLKGVPFNVIDCLILTNYSDPQKRYDLSKGKLCLAEFRAYLLSRQCALLQLLNKYQEIPSLVYNILISFLNECRILNLDIDSSIKNSWIFLTSLQALQRFSPIDCENRVAQDYAALFLLALNSVNKLAEGWNIWSKESIDWSPIKALVGKLSVLNNDEFGDTPSSRLAGGLKSQKHFQGFHKKLYEEALVILKHIGRIRTASYLGVQLADLYCQIGNYEDAEPFYLKAIKCLLDENWTHLAMPLRLKLAVCQKYQFERDPEKYLKTCVHLAGARFAESGSYFNSYVSLKSNAEHEIYIDELRNCLIKYFDKFKKSQVFRLEPLFSIKNIKLLSPTDGYQTIELLIISFLPESIDANLCISGEKFGELDLTQSQSTKSHYMKENYLEDELNEFPAQYSISLSDQPSPALYRTNNSRNHVVKENRLYHQSSTDEEIPSLNEGISVQMDLCHNYETGKDDTVFTLVCFPKADDGSRARKYSISRDITFPSVVTENNVNSNLITEEATCFVNDNDVIFCPGENKLILKSKELGLFLPRNIQISIFNDRLQLKDFINDIKMDNSFCNIKTLESFLPDFLFESGDTIAFVNFNNEIKANIRMGYLSLPKDYSDVELCVKSASCKESYSVQKLNIRDDIQSALLYRSEASLCGSLCYNLDSINDQLYMRIPGLIKKPIEISFFEEILITQKIIPTSSCKYIVQVDLKKPFCGVILKRNYVIKSSSLKLHHGIDLCQLLPIIHRSLSTGIFNEYMQLSLLWFLEIVDIHNFEMDSLTFTLALDLLLQSNGRGISGSIRHEFELSLC